MCTAIEKGAFLFLRPLFIHRAAPNPAHNHGPVPQQDIKLYRLGQLNHGERMSSPHLVVSGHHQKQNQGLSYVHTHVHYMQRQYENNL